MTVNDVLHQYLVGHLPLLRYCEIRLRSAHHLDIKALPSDVLDEILQADLLLELAERCLAIEIRHIWFEQEPQWIEIDCQYLLQCWQ